MTQFFIGCEVGLADDHDRRGVIVDNGPDGWRVWWCGEEVARDHLASDLWPRDAEGAPPWDFVLAEVSDERNRQDAKWGEQNHDPYLYGAILSEEVGEAAQAALKSRFEGGDPAALRGELIQVAAVAVAFVECLDRGKWRWGGHADPA